MSATLAPPDVELELNDEGGDDEPCAYCDGQGEICHPRNADPRRAIRDWLPPVLCPRCGGTGKDPCP